MLAVVFALTAGACGPERPFELGLKEVPSDLLLGRQTKPVQAAPTQLPPAVFTFTEAITPAPPTVTTVPPPLPDPPPPPLPCSEADPLAPARLPISTDVPRPPAPAAYTYRTDGFVVGLASQTIAKEATHEVLNVVPLGPGEFEFDIAVRLGTQTTQTTYHVVPRSSAAVAPVPAPGLYIKRVETQGAEFSTFEPVPELLILPFPALPGITFRGGGTDGVTTISYEGVVEPTLRLDVCGVPIDTIPVTLFNGRSTTGRTADGTFLAEQFNATYHFGTQYGGLALRHSLKAENPAGGAVSARELHGTITGEPKDPQ